MPGVRAQNRARDTRPQVLPANAAPASCERMERSACATGAGVKV